MKMEFPSLTKSEWKVATLWKPYDEEKDSRVLAMLGDPEYLGPGTGGDVRLPTIYKLFYASLKSAGCAAYLFGWIDYHHMQSRGGRLLYKLVRTICLGSSDQVLIWYYVIRLGISKDVDPEEFSSWLKTLGSYKKAAQEYEAQLRFARNLRKAARRTISSPS